MELINPTPLPGIAFRQFDMDGGLDCVVAVRAAFAHQQNARATWIETQPPLQWEDAYDGPPLDSVLLHQTDLTPGKIGTDVTFLGDSHPEAGPSREWRCGLAIGPVSKSLRVTGPRRLIPQRKSRWRKTTLAGWSLDAPAPAAAVPMDWRLALGGKPVFAKEPVEPDPRNPVGTGLPGDASPDEATPIPAPQILAPGDGADSIPAGLGPVAPFWKGRADHAGTYDDIWQQTRHPLLPRDFSPRFWQCAPPDQIAIPFLLGDEGYRLIALSPSHHDAIGWLPDLALAVQINGGVWHRLDLDGVQFDWRAGHRITLTWRARFPLPEADGATLRLGWRMGARMQEGVA